MVGENIRAKLEELIKSTVVSMGYEFWGMEFYQQKASNILRVYVDSTDGINLDSIREVSYQISAVLDVEDIMTYKYMLEVSSPGLDRILFNADQYKRFIGSSVRIKLLGGNSQARHNYLGVIDSVTDSELTITSDGEKIILPLNDIEKVRVVPKFKF